MTNIEVVKVREKKDTEIIFASMEDMRVFFDLITNGQGVIFDYVDSCGERIGEYIDPSILTLINDGKLKITSKERK